MQEDQIGLRPFAKPLQLLFFSPYTVRAFCGKREKNTSELTISNRDRRDFDIDERERNRSSLGRAGERFSGTQAVLLSLSLVQTAILPMVPLCAIEAARPRRLDQNGPGSSAEPMVQPGSNADG